ncbi:MAG: PIG-L family deacetylase [Proteobacteria bacterium]|jgi:LmbE family N-acetylglucosaminyl deacetylase|nr:PIG-L family deacetylase [Pseudomonadota bacterium]
MRVLVLSAHPDDETIGAGGTLLRHIDNGDEVHWCIVTQPHSPAWPESAMETSNQQIDAVSVAYGMTSVHRLGFPTVQLNTVPYNELSKAIQGVVDRVRPEVVYLPPSSDLNQDHRIVNECGLVATRPIPDCSVKEVLAYEISTTSRYWNTPFVPNVYVDITLHLKRKIEIMRLFEAEIKAWPHPRSPEGLEVLAKERGMGVGVKAAECFSLLRKIVY